MKTLYLDIDIKTDEKFEWKVAPLETRWSYEHYEYHACEYTYTTGKNPGDIGWIVRKYKAILQGFLDNVIGCYAAEVKAIFQKAIDSDWSNDFRVDEWIHSAQVSIRFHIDDQSEKLNKYVLWVTDEQEEFLDNIVFDVTDESFDRGTAKPDEIKKAIINQLILGYKEYLEKKYEERLDEIYGKDEEATNG